MELFNSIFLIETGMPTLDLCVIAKDSAATLPACLASVKGLVSSMVVVDTGSCDGTQEVARQHGAKVISFKWCGDFAAARNAALAAVDSDWILVLDADEELDGGAHAWIRKELEAPRADAYITPVRNYLKPWENPLTGAHDLLPEERHPAAPDAKAYVHSEVCRLYRRNPDIYYIGHVHEQVEYRLMQLGRRIGRADFFIHHFGWYLIDEHGLERKRTMYADLLAEKARQRPDDPLVLLQYGDALCAWAGKTEEGLALFMKAAALNPNLQDLWIYIALALLKLGQLEAALIALGQIPPKERDRARLAQMRGEALGALKRWSEARAAYEEALKYDPDSIAIMAKLGLIEMEDGSPAKGMRRMRRAIAAAEAQAEKHDHARPYLCAAELCAQVKEWDDALRLTTKGLAIDPSLGALQEIRLQAAVATNRLAEAAESAASLAKGGASPRAFLRHAAILNQAGDRLAARGALTRGLGHFPDAELLHQALAELAAPAMQAAVIEVQHA